MTWRGGYASAPNERELEASHLTTIVIPAAEIQKMFELEPIKELMAHVKKELDEEAAPNRDARVVRFLRERAKVRRERHVKARVTSPVRERLVVALEIPIELRVRAVMSAHDG